MARHQQLHIFTRRAVAILTLDDDLINILVINIADRAFDEITIAVDQRWRGGLKRRFTDTIPNTRKIIKIAADFDLST